MRKITAFLIVISIFFSMNTINVFAENTADSQFSSEFISASDDTIVCYMDGIPIKKAYVDAYGIVTQEALEQAMAECRSRIQTRETPTSVYMTLPAGYNNAIVKTTLAAPRYSQKNTYYYMTKDNANIFAMSFDTGSSEALVAMLAGFIPHIGPTITIMFTISSLRNAEIATKIRNLTNANKKVRINCMSSSYGTFFGVFEWSGRTFETHKLYNPGTTETVTHIQFK